MKEAQPPSIARVIAVAQRRLGRSRIRAALGRQAAIVSSAAALCAASRPFIWPLDGADTWKAAARTVTLALLGAGAATAVVSIRAWRSRPSMLASARRLDEALGLAEVAASAFAFERDGRHDEMAEFVVGRARQALDGVVIDRALVRAPYQRSRRERVGLVLAAAATVIALAIGAVDRVVLERAIHPVTQREAAAAADLRKSAEIAANAATGPTDENDRRADELARAARRAAEAAKRGDRQRASEALEDMRKTARSIEADARAQARSLRTLRDELERAAGPSGRGSPEGRDGASDPARPSRTAAEALAKLKKELDGSGPDKDSLRDMIERLERAEKAARAAAENAKADKDGAGAKGKEAREARSTAWSRAAAALAEAREAAARGDKEAASRAMERAKREVSAMEKASGDPAKSRAMARLADEASELDRSMRAAMTGERFTGKGSPEADPGTDGKGRSSSSNADADEKAGGAAPAAGPGAADRTPGPEQRRVKLEGDLQARTDVREGERAVRAIEGMGRGGDPKAYREIFPSYDTVVEDGLREDTVPAARRPTVRRYFSAIRPGSDDESRTKP